MSVSRVRSNALLSSWLHRPSSSTSPNGSLASDLPLQLTAFDQQLTASTATSQLQQQVYQRITRLLDGGNGEDVWTALVLLRDVIGDCSSSESEVSGGDAVNSAVSSTSGNSGTNLHSFRAHLDHWCKMIHRLLRVFLEQPRPSSSTSLTQPVKHPSVTSSLTPLLTLTAFETWYHLLRRLYDQYVDTRKEITNTTLPAALTLLLKMIAISDTTQWTNKKEIAVWSFPPPDALERSLTLLLELFTLYRHSLRFGTEKILAAIVPLLGHQESIVRRLAARIIGASALIQPVTSKKKTDDQDVDEEEEEKKTTVAAPASAIHSISQPEDPWTLCFHRTLNTFHSLMDELDEAGDALVEQGATSFNWKSLPRPTDASLTFSALPTPSLARAEAFSLRLQGVCELLQALMEPTLFSELYIPSVGTNHDALTIAIPIAALQAALNRLFIYELNPHTLTQITGRPLHRTAIVTILPTMTQAAIRVLSSLIETTGVYAQSLTQTIGQTIRELLARYAFNTSEGRHPVPMIVPDLYALATQFIHAIHGSGVTFIRSFVLPILTLALEDAERLVRQKNATAQFQRTAVQLSAFTGAALQKQQPSSRKSGGGKSSDQSEDGVTFVQSLHVNQSAVIGVAALEFIDAIITTVGPMLPQQKRIQLDRSLCSIALAFQSASWQVIDSYRLAVYQCLTSSVLTPIAPASNERITEVGLLSSFSLLPYATQLFSTALHDPSTTIHQLVHHSLRICQSLLHPRGLPLASARNTFVQDATLVATETSSEGGNELGALPGLVRGRDGSLYMEMTGTTTNNKVDQIKATTVAASGAPSPAPIPPSTPTPASFSLTSPIPVISSVVGAVGRVGTKRGRDTDERTDETSSDAITAAKRPHLEPVVATTTQPQPQPIPSPTTLNQPIAASPSSTTASTTAAPSSTTSNLTTRALPSATLAVTNASVDIEDDSIPLVADAGPDEDEGEQGSLWNL